MNNGRIKIASRLGIALLVALMLIPPYVLSYGPMSAWRVRGYVPEALIETLYAPLVWICDRIDTLGFALLDYRENWTRPLTFRVNSDPIVTPASFAGNSQAMSDRRAALLELTDVYAFTDWEKLPNGEVQIKSIGLPVAMQADVSRFANLFPEAQVCVDEFAGRP